MRLAATVCLSCMTALVKWSGLRGVPVFEIVFFRNAFAFLPLGIFIWRTKGISVLKTQRPLGHLTRSAIGIVAMICGFSAVQHLPLTEATALQFSSPMFMTAMSALFLSEKVGVHRWLAVLVGFVGVLIMARPVPGHMNLVGVAFGVMSAIGTAGATITIRQIARTERGPTIVFYFTLGGTVAGLIGAIATGWVDLDPLTFTMLVLAGVLGGMGQMLLTEALRLAPPSIVAPFDYAQLVWATVLGLLIWGDLPKPLTLVGAVVVVSSGLYILHRELKVIRAVQAEARKAA